MRFHNCVHYALVFLCGLVERSVRRWCTLKLLMVTWSSYNKILLLFQSPKKSSLKHWREKMSLLKRERERAVHEKWPHLFVSNWPDLATLQAPKRHSIWAARAFALGTLVLKQTQATKHVLPRLLLLLRFKPCAACSALANTESTESLPPTKLDSTLGTYIELPPQILKHQGNIVCFCELTTNGRTYLFQINPTWQCCKQLKDIQ